jgi:2-dehydro-3-deoxyphosphooctonate aldolase (KDO 8-P synthase)
VIPTVPAVEVRPGLRIGGDAPPVLLGGPCVIESPEICRRVAGTLSEICARLGIGYVFKASFDKANRTSVTSFRGPGMEKGLETLAAIRAEFGVPVVTDIHEPSQAAPAGEVVDILQIPAFLCRQTDLLVAAGETGKCVNIKKGQFLAGEDMAAAVGKVRTTGNGRICLTERGTTFGYHNFVVDMRSLPTMADLGVPVIFDGTHSVQLPSGQGSCSGGDRRFVAPLVRAAAAVGIHGLFLEIHPDPDQALCDGPNSLPLAEAESLLKTVKALNDIVRTS